eukprot:IDg14668t1
MAVTVCGRGRSRLRGAPLRRPWDAARDCTAIEKIGCMPSVVLAGIDCHGLNRGKFFDDLRFVRSSNGDTDVVLRVMIGRETHVVTCHGAQPMVTPRAQRKLRSCSPRSPHTPRRLCMLSYFPRIRPARSFSCITSSRRFCELELSAETITLIGSAALPSTRRFSRICLGAAAPIASRWRLPTPCPPVEMGTENGGTVAARTGTSTSQLVTANNSDNTDEITRGPPTAPPPKPRTKPSGAKNKSTTRPTKKKVRAAPPAPAAPSPAEHLEPPSPPPAPPVAIPNGNVPAAAPPAAPAPAAPDAVGTNGTRTRGLTTAPRTMDEYRVGCLRLEKVRHEKMFESEKRRLYSERSIERAYEWDVRGADESYASGLKVIMTRMLTEN